MIQMQRSVVPERLIANTILCELKRTALSYTEAAMDANAPDVKRTFERLAQDTLRKHEQLAVMMRQNQLLEFVGPAEQREVQREAQRSRNTARALQQMMTQGRIPPASSPYMQGIPGYSMNMNGQRNPQIAAYPPPGSRPPEYALPHMPSYVEMQGSYVNAPLLHAEPAPIPDAARAAEPTPEETPAPTKEAVQAKRGRRSKAIEASAAEDSGT